MGIFDNLDQLNKKIESSNWYKFMDRHKRVINIVEGVIVIALLISINSYLFKDRQLKEQIADHCGYETREYKCICNKDYVDKADIYSDVNKQLRTVFNSDIKINMSEINEMHNG